MRSRPGKRAAAALLAFLMIFLAACGPERPPYATMPWGTTQSPAQTKTTAAPDPSAPTEANWRTEARGLSDEVVELPEWPYHSPALDFVPMEGIRVTAEAGALYDDTEISLTPLTEEGEQRLLKIADDFKDYGEPLIGAWEVHAGLEPDEHLPGEYTVSIDLAALDLDESLWPAVRLYRLSDDGKLTVYNTSLDGSVLSYSTDRNSITVASLVTCVVVGLALGIPVYYAAEKAKADWYYWDGTGASYHYGKTKYGNYTIKWSMKDVDPKQQEKNDRLVEIAKKYRPEAEADYEQEKKDREDMSVLYRMFTKNKSVEERLKDYLVGDKEYQEVASSLKTPELIVEVAKAIDLAYDYLGGEVYARMPKDDLTFRLKRTDGTEKEDTYGNSVATMLSDSYIEINVDKIIGLLNGDEAGEMDRDNMLLTITHELFHICQERYHFRFLTDSIRFDEMTALILEEDARDYYREKGLITTDPPLTQINYWGTMRLPIDESLTFNSLVMRHQGYLLSELVRYLREKTGLKPDGVDIYRCRSYHKKPVTSLPLMAAFRLSEVTFDELFRRFCLDHVKDFTSNFTEDEARKEYNIYPRSKLEKDKGTHVSVGADGSYSAGVRCFDMYDTGRLPLLVIMDKDLAAQHPELNLVPGETYVSVRGGAYLPGPEKWVGASLTNRLFLEVYGKLGPNTGATAGYTVWPMDAPDEPKLGYADGTLSVTLPTPRGAAKEGLLDGVILKIASSDGKKTEKEYLRDLMGKTVTIPLRELLEDGTEQAELSVSLAEFVYSTKDKACPGRFSKEVKIPVSYAVKGQSYQYNSTTMVTMTQDMVHPALRDAFEKSTLYMSEDGSFTISGSGQASREPEDENYTVEGSVSAQFTITGHWDEKKGEGTAVISGSVTRRETYAGFSEKKEVSNVKDRDGRRMTLTTVNRSYSEEITDFSYSFSGSGTVRTATQGDLFKGIDGLVLNMGSDWTRSGKSELWRWKSYERTGDPEYEYHEITEKELDRTDDHKDPWEEGWKICWTIGKQEPVLHVGSSVMPFTPGGN